jgi:hypothetical protein
MGRRSPPGYPLGYLFELPNRPSYSAVAPRVPCRPALPEQRRAALLAVASHRTIHNTLHQPPEIDIELEP